MFPEMDGDDCSSLYASSEPFLAAGDFSGIRRLVAASPHAASSAAARILAISQILSPTQPDHYSLLSLPRFSSDPTRIRTQFKTLALLLNPNTNPLSVAPLAFQNLLEAYSVLSDPTKKDEYDNFLRISDGSGASRKPTFWTVCPYCYYVYEYDRVYVDCCLRCRNEGCRKGFTALEVSVAPPEAVAGSGRYLCLGFGPIGFKGFSTWSPFENRDVDGLEKMGFKRRKSVGVCSKKVMGKGVRVSSDEIDRIFAGV